MLAAMLFLAAAGCASAATVTFTAVDSTKRATAGAEVSVRSTAGRDARCTTNDAGICRLELPDGTYAVTATRNGELEGRTAVRVKGETAATVALNPSPLRTSVTVVSGSRQQELQEESATKVEAVTRAQMLSTGYERVSDVLGEIPGVLVRRGSTSTVGGEQIQGVDSRQVLVLQDGLPIIGAL